jgi:TonB family protein
VALSGLLALGAVDPIPLLIEPGANAYPADDSAKGIEGDVPVTLAIDVDGKVRCSAHSEPDLGSLRQASCDLVVGRNIFGLRTVEGKLTATTYDFLVRWRRNAGKDQFGGAVPIGRPGWITYADYPPIARHQMLTGRVALSFEVSERGTVENCKVSRTNATSSLADAMCPLLSSRAIFLPATDHEGRPRRTLGRFVTDWRWCDSGRWQSCVPPDRRE